MVATKATIETKECVATVHTASDVITETYPIVFEFNTPEEGNNPKVEKININGVDYTQTSNEILNAPQNGAIKIKFSRTMIDATITSTEKTSHVLRNQTTSLFSNTGMLLRVAQ